MRKFQFLTFLLLLVLVGCQAKNKKEQQLYGIGFYNLENLFDTTHEEGKNDYEFLPEGSFKWDAEKYKCKLHNMARVLADMGTDKLPDVGCAAIGVAEVENAKCLTDLCNQPALKARNFKFVHIEGPDQRGIDCALLYNPQLFKVKNVKLVPYIYTRPEDAGRTTRGFLVVSGTLANEHVTIIVNHLPSRGAASYAREDGGTQLRAVKDSLQKDDPKVKLFIMGDMNDDPNDASMAKCLGAKREISEVEEGGLYNPWWNMLASGQGTLQYQGAWNLFDQIILSKNLLNKAGQKDYSTLKLYDYQVFRRDYLIQQEGEFRGNTLRTSAGGKWLNGYSDHLPTLVYLLKK